MITYEQNRKLEKSLSEGDGRYNYFPKTKLWVNFSQSEKASFVTVICMNALPHDDINKNNIKNINSIL